MLSDILIMLLVFLLSFFLLRGLFWNIIIFQLNNKARKKAREGQSFKEWLFYLRYRTEIPKFLILTYLAFLLVNLFVLSSAILFFYLNFIDYISIGFKALVIIDFGLIIILDVCFYGRRKNGQTYYKVERWVKKRKKK